MVSEGPHITLFMHPDRPDRLSETAQQQRLSGLTSLLCWVFSPVNVKSTRTVPTTWSRQSCWSATGLLACDHPAAHGTRERPLRVPAAEEPVLARRDPSDARCRQHNTQRFAPVLSPLPPPSTCSPDPPGPVSACCTLAQLRHLFMSYFDCRRSQRGRPGRPATRRILQPQASGATPQWHSEGRRRTHARGAEPGRQHAVARRRDRRGRRLAPGRRRWQVCTQPTVAVQTMCRGVRRRKPSRSLHPANLATSVPHIARNVDHFTPLSCRAHSLHGHVHLPSIMSMWSICHAYLF